MQTIDFSDFLKVDIRCAEILSAEPLEGARKPAYRLELDCGPELGIKQSSAQVTDLYRPEGLKGKRVLCVVNFPPKRIAGFKSEVLVLGLDSTDGGVSLIGADHHVKPGSRLY